jgi:hypothetical protein
MKMWLTTPFTPLKKLLELFPIFRLLKISKRINQCLATAAKLLGIEIYGKFNVGLMQMKINWILCTQGQPEILSYFLMPILEKILQVQFRAFLVIVLPFRLPQRLSPIERHR